MFVDKKGDGMNKKLLLASGLIGGAAGFFVGRCVYEMNSLEVVEYEIYSRKLKEDRKLVFLSDLHDHQFGKANSVLLEAVRDEAPDAILIGGDMMTCNRKMDIGDTLELCTYLVQIAPTYYAKGNHELRMREREYRRQSTGFSYFLWDMGVEYLEDYSSMLGEDIRITGLDIPKKYYARFLRPSMSDVDISLKVGRSDDRYFNILLAHVPSFLSAYSRWGADLVLSGHFHGGLVRLGDRGLATPDFRMFSPMVGGMHRMGETDMIVSAGLGTHDINVRINNKPQLVVVHLKREE